MTGPSFLRSATFSPAVIAEIERAADQGVYQIRGFGTLRPLPSFDDLVLLGASMSRYPLEGYRERCATNVTLGTRFAAKPIELKIPITIAGMSFGAIGGNAKRALGRGASGILIPPEGGRAFVALTGSNSIAVIEALDEIGVKPVAVAGTSIGALVGEEFDQKFSKRSTLTERFTFFPNLSHGGEYRMQFDTTVATQLKAWLSWQATFSDRYISYPPPGIKGNDLLLSTGLRVTWGKVKL